MDNAPRTILIVDDEAAQRQLLSGFLQSIGMHTEEASSAEEALVRLRHLSPDLILLDVNLPGRTGIEVLPELRRIAARLPIFLITAYGEVRDAVTAMKQGADDYLLKPIDLNELETMVFETLGRPSDTCREERQASLRKRLPASFICESAAMYRVVESIAMVAPSTVPVLIQGPSGAGKEVVAQLLHMWSPRALGPMIAANCAGLSESLIESELFGHTRGAYTGAEDTRQGFFRAAHGGTLFLDEIGELPLRLQPKLLRALETRLITPVGSDWPIEVDTRLIAATNRDLGKDVDAGMFRKDLYYRINVVELRVPPLSERVDDITSLARYFAAAFAGKPVRFSPQAEKSLLNYPWPGNVRELRNAIQRACLLCESDVILPEHLPTTIIGTPQLTAELEATMGRLSQVERNAILATLAECKGNRTQAAHKLGISRRTLLTKIHAMGIENEKTDGH